MPGKIPDRWLDYEPLGQPIKGTRFITFKVPLEKGITAGLSVEKQFTPELLVEKTKLQGQELGLVVDLTNTKRYYKSQDLLNFGIKYAKVYTEGHVVPSKKVCSKFFAIIDSYLNDGSYCDKLVGVHCTHGVNRTGYMVCRYMIDRLGFKPEEAIEAYHQARGHSIERQNYLEALMKDQCEDLTEDVSQLEVSGDTLSQDCRRDTGRSHVSQWRSGGQAMSDVTWPVDQYSQPSRTSQNQRYHPSTMTMRYSDSSQPFDRYRHWDRPHYRPYNYYRNDYVDGGQFTGAHGNGHDQWYQGGQRNFRRHQNGRYPRYCDYTPRKVGRNVSTYRSSPWENHQGTSR